MTETPRRDWRQLAEAARDEEDPGKLMILIEQLNRALEMHVKGTDPPACETAD